LKCRDEKGEASWRVLPRRIGRRSGERQGATCNEEAGGYDKHVKAIRQLLVENQNLQKKEEEKAVRA
jgi:hypothetical protein